MIVSCQQQPISPIPTPTPSPGSVLVTYQRSGGIFGFDDRLTIYDGGRCELQRRLVKQEFTLQPNQLARLKDLFERANFFSLQDEYLEPLVVSDSIQLTITYQSMGEKHTVRTESFTIPDALAIEQYLVGQLSAYFE
jgi:hypothetical protein